MIETNDKIAISLRNEKYTITRYFFQCKFCPEEYSHSSKNDEEMTKIYNHYRQKYNMLDPEQIKTLRIRLGKSFNELLSDLEIDESFSFLESRGCLLPEEIDQKLKNYFKSFNLL